MRSPPLTTDLLRIAYARGFFPMPHPATGETLWFHPDPRAILPLDGFHRSRSFQRMLRQTTLTATIDQNFTGVINACSNRDQTWITEEFKRAYGALHREGTAHSIEIWRGQELVGGLYGVALNGAFFAESMFHTVTDASKMALHHLVEHMRSRGMSLIEVQFLTSHLASLGAIEVSRSDYMELLAAALASPARFS